MHKVRITPGRVLLALAALTFLACAGGGPGPTYTMPPATEAPPAVTISLDEFNRLTPGMTQAEAEAVVGGPGTPTSQTEIAGHQSLGVMWPGDSVGSNAQVMFSAGKLTTKAQFGLK